MKFKIIILLLIISIFSLINSCKTDFDLNANWKDITIVYGLLNQDSVTYIKISKAFLGEGNTMTYARSFDSTNYNPNEIEVSLLEYNKYGSLVQSYPLSATKVNKQSGIFGDPVNPLQYIYQTPPNVRLNEKFSYKLNVKNKKSNKIVSSQTNLIFGSELTVINPQQSTPKYKISVSFIRTQTVEWYSATNGRAYQVVIRFNYEEKNKQTNNHVHKYVDWELPLIPATNLLKGNNMKYEFIANQFYVVLSSNIPADPNVWRIPGKVEYLLMVSGDDYYTYIEINKPTLSIVQERPNYTNITNGLGLFSSRYIKKVSVYLNKYSTDTLIMGRYTKHLSFIDTIKFDPRRK